MSRKQRAIQIDIVLISRIINLMKTTLFTPTEKKVLKSFKRQLTKELGNTLVKIVIFGSRATGQATEDSDIDIAVIIKERELKIKILIWDIANEFLISDDLLISPLVLSSDEYQNLLRRERAIALTIASEGVTL